MEDKNNRIHKDEIDLIELAKAVWLKRLFIVKIVGVFFVFGLIVAFTSKVEFRSFCKLLPESQEGSQNLGSLGGLAGLAGFDLSGLNSSGSLSPEVYPMMANSAPFISELINTPIYFEKNDTVISSFIYFKEIDNPSLFGYVRKYFSGLSGKVKKLFNRNTKTKTENLDYIRFSSEDWGIIEDFRTRLSVSVDEETRMVTITSLMPDPVAAAKITDLLMHQLTGEISKYRTEKAETNLLFVQERYLEAKTEYIIKQRHLAKFSDRNRNISNPIIQTEYERLRNELSVSFEVYKGLSTQLEKAKIKVKEETPVFTVIEPARIPEDKSSPQRLIILILFSFLGLSLSIGWLIVKKTFKIN